MHGTISNGRKKGGTEKNIFGSGLKRPTSPYLNQNAFPGLPSRYSVLSQASCIVSVITSKTYLVTTNASYGGLSLNQHARVKNTLTPVKIILCWRLEKLCHLLHFYRYITQAQTRSANQQLGAGAEPPNHKAQQTRAAPI